jgi:hypothetical protein
VSIGNLSYCRINSRVITPLFSEFNLNPCLYIQTLGGGRLTRTWANPGRRIYVARWAPGRRLRSADPVSRNITKSPSPRLREDAVDITSIRRPSRRNVQYPALLGYPDCGFPCFSSVVRQILEYKWKGARPSYTWSWRPSAEMTPSPQCRRGLRSKRAQF